MNKSWEDSNCDLPPVPSTLSSSKWDISTRPLPVRFTKKKRKKRNESLAHETVTQNQNKFPPPPPPNIISNFSWIWTKQWMTSNRTIQQHQQKKNPGMMNDFFFVNNKWRKEETTTFRWTEIEPGWPDHFLIKIHREREREREREKETEKAKQTQDKGDWTRISSFISRKPSQNF